MGKCSNIVGLKCNYATDHANKDTEEEHVFFILACVQHEVFAVFAEHRVDPNPAVILIEVVHLYHIKII